MGGKLGMHFANESHESHLAKKHMLHLDMIWEEMWELEDKSGMYLMLDWEAKSGEELTKRNMKSVASTYNRFKSFGRFMMYAEDI